MIIVASSNGDVGIAAGMDVLRHGGSAVDAVEVACRLVEDNLDDHSVGTGAYPNLVGEVELDASIMDGSSRAAGAVAALKGYPHPISVARSIMDHLPQHLLLVGDGAARFAAEQGFVQAVLLTDFAEAAFRQRTLTLSGEEYSFDALAPAKMSPTEQVTRMGDPSKIHGTVNFLALDSFGQLASAVSTSGWAFKYPGRTGDSAIIGAGNYCDSRFGACACTGLGEWAIRSSTARLVVYGLQIGRALASAAEEAVRDLGQIAVLPQIQAAMNFVVLDPEGRHGGFTTEKGRTYLWQDQDMLTFETVERHLLEPFDNPIV